jgi:glycosyltransferase involved in cell wall biosynthesis
VITTPAFLSSGIRTRLEAKIAKKIGFEVDLVTGWGMHDSQLISQKMPEINELTNNYLTKYIYPHKDFMALVSLYNHFKKNRYEIVQTHLSKAGIIGRLAAALAKVPIIIHDVAGFGFHTGNSYKNSFYLTLERMVGRFTTHYIFYADHLKQTYKKNIIGNRAVKKVIFPGMNLARFNEAPPLSPESKARYRAEWGISPEDLVFGYASRMVLSKGHHYLIEAFNILRKKRDNCKLLLVGGPLWPEEITHMENLKKLMLRYGLEDKVIFTGHQNNILQFYQLMDVFVMPSMHEGTANVMLEAITTGLPILAFDIPAVREFAPEETITCPVGDIQGLAQIMETAVGNSHGKGNKGKGNKINLKKPSEPFRKNLVDNFSPVSWEEKLIKFYEDILLGARK